MPMRRPAAAIEPVSRMPSIRSALPGPKAISLPRTMRSRATGPAERDPMGGCMAHVAGGGNPPQSSRFPPGQAEGRKKMPHLPLASCVAAHPMLSCPAVGGESRMPRSNPQSGSHLFENVVNPFCGTLADDLDVERTDAGLKVVKNGCSQSVAGFERKLPAANPSVNGKNVELSAAIEEAARLIAKAKLPLFGGLATDVGGMRAVMALAERTGGVVDHALSEAQYRNLKILQTSGWVTTTLTETRNRADLIIIAGSDIHRLHPRFFERIVSPPDSM